MLLVNIVALLSVFYFYDWRLQTQTNYYNIKEIIRFFLVNYIFNSTKQVLRQNENRNDTSVGFLEQQQEKVYIILGLRFSNLRFVFLR